MVRLDHHGMKIGDLAHSMTHFDPVLTAFGFTRQDAVRSVCWYIDGTRRSSSSSLKSVDEFRFCE